MNKTDPDSTDFAATFKVPDNVGGTVAEIVGRASRTYPDHRDSREEMIRQELIMALSRERELRYAFAS
jgi:hypothetical protein